MKQTPLNRKPSLRDSQADKNRKRLQDGEPVKGLAKKAKRQGRKKSAIILPEYLAYIRTLPCLICGWTAQAHHVIHRGANDGFRDDRTCVPLCVIHHAEVHYVGKKTFDKKREIVLADEYARLWAEYDA